MTTAKHRVRIRGCTALVTCDCLLWQAIETMISKVYSNCVRFIFCNSQLLTQFTQHTVHCVQMCAALTYTDLFNSVLGKGAHVCKKGETVLQKNGVVGS